MKEEILVKLYSNPQLLEYLRHNPKWYYYLEQDPKNFTLFEKTAKKALKIQTVDKLEKLKNQINFASAIMKYFTK
jgi:hypothetical protein